MDLAVFAVRAAVLVVLWAFVLAAVLVVRTDVLRPRTAPQRTPAGRPSRPAPAPARPRRRRDARLLAVTQGPLTGTTLTLGESPVTIGRADDCTLVVSSDDYVSSRHARLSPADGGWVVEDLGSTNGTFIGDTRVTRPTPIRAGTAIRVGQTVLELRR